MNNLNFLQEWMVWALAGFTVLNGAVYYTYLWQLKEYRLDRVLEALNQRSFRSKIFAPFLMAKWLFFLIGFFFWLDGNISFQSWVLLLIWAIGFEFAELLWRGIRRQIYRPDPTLKAALIIFLELAVFALLLGIFHWAGFSPGLEMFWIFVASLFVADINSIIVFSFTPVTVLMKQRLIEKAKIKIQNRKDLVTIGITGSFGKSSTKEFLFQILKNKFKVLKTPGNTNVDIGVAKIILNQLKPEHQVFIAEMGAYKRGEIRNIVEIVHPDVGIITAVHKAHLGLFGSVEKIAEAKFELIVGVKEGGVGIFNCDDNGANNLYQKAEIYPIERLSVGLQDSPNLKAENVSVKNGGLDFKIGSQDFQTRLFGTQNLPNLLLAIAAAKYLGMSMEEISKAVAEIEPVSRTMKLKKLSEQLWIVDDSYNANPIGVKAAIESLDLIEGATKIMFFPGMLELGKHSDEEHQKIGELIGKKIDHFFMSSRDFEKPLKAGLEQTNSKCHYYIGLNKKETIKKLKKIIEHKKAVILLESRGSEYVEKLLNPQK